jgi:hypothetical protein
MADALTGLAAGLLVVGVGVVDVVWGVVLAVLVAAPAADASAPDAMTTDAVSARTRCGMRDMSGK